MVNWKFWAEDARVAEDIWGGAKAADRGKDIFDTVKTGAEPVINATRGIRDGVGKVVYPIGRFAIKHPAAVIVPAAVAGVVAAHPFAATEQAFTGDRHYLGKMAGASLMGSVPFIQPPQPGFGMNINGGPGITTEGGQFSINPDPDMALRGSESGGANPSGDIVFGLYNNRLR